MIANTSLDANGSKAIPSTNGVAPSKGWFWASASFIGFWLLGVGFAWWIVVPPLLYIHSAKAAKAHWKASSLWLLALGFWLIASIGANALGGTVSPSRLLGGLFAAVVWVAAALLSKALSAAAPREVYYFLCGLITLTSIQGLLSLAAVLLHPSPLSNLRLPLSAISGTSSLASWSDVSLAADAWFGGPVVRSNGMMGASAWTGAFTALVLIILILNRRYFVVHGMRTSTWWVALISCASSLILSYARLPIAVFIVAFVLSVAIWVSQRVLGRGGVAITVLLASTSALVVLLAAPVDEFLQSQDSLRPGSSVARGNSYESGIQTAVSGGPWILLAGNGVKPALEEGGYGAGSESTVVSLLVRGGLIGVVLYVAFVLSRLQECLKTRDFGGVAVVIAFCMLAVFSDADTGTLLLVLPLLPALGAVPKIFGDQKRIQKYAGRHLKASAKGIIPGIQR
jgi:hypothetical protein